MHKAVISLGSNKGDRIALMQAAFMALKTLGSIEQYSSIQETEPWGFQADVSFLNQIVVLHTNFAPLDLLDQLQYIEKSLGKDTHSPTHGYASRTMDLDILYFDDLQLNSERLMLPHPHIQDREFIILLLQELGIQTVTLQ